jgi:uncharacterized protein (DUF433 family)
MNLEDYFDFLGTDIIRFKGHRINLEHVVRYYNEGYSPEQIAQEYPGLTLEAIHAGIAYYLHNKADVDTMIKRIDEGSERAYQQWSASSAFYAPVAQRMRLLRDKATPET